MTRLQMDDRFAGSGTAPTIVAVGSAAGSMSVRFASAHIPTMRAQVRRTPQGRVSPASEGGRRRLQLPHLLLAQVMGAISA